MTTYAIMVLAALAGGIIQPLTGFGSAVILMVAGGEVGVLVGGGGKMGGVDARGSTDCHTGVRAGSQ